VAGIESKVKEARGGKQVWDRLINGSTKAVEEIDKVDSEGWYEEYIHLSWIVRVNEEKDDMEEKKEVEYYYLQNQALILSQVH
jgi:hypothetical protein